MFKLSTLFLATSNRISRFETMNTKFIFIFLIVCCQSIFSQDCDSCRFFSVPNTLTPDCEEFGCEFLKIKSNCEIREFELLIYNRWGEHVFESVDQQIEFNSSDVQDGTYLWVLSGAFCEDQKFKLSGYVTVVR